MPLNWFSRTIQVHTQRLYSVDELAKDNANKWNQLQKFASRERERPGFAQLNLLLSELQVLWRNDTAKNIRFDLDSLLPLC